MLRALDDNDDDALAMTAAPAFDRFQRLWAAATLCALLAACAAPLPPGPRGGTAPSSDLPAPAVPADGRGSAAPTAPASPAPATASPVSTEQRFLEDWFRGTPVVIALQGAATLAVDVPMANSFDPGASVVKPALGAVLDRVAESLRRQPATRITIAAAPDAHGPAALAATRAQRVRDHLVSRQVPPARIATLGGSAPGAPVQLRIVLPAAPIARLDDKSLVVPAAGVKPASTAKPQKSLR